MKKARYLVWFGSIVLAVTAALHGTGYTEVSATVATSDLEGVLASAIPGLWVFASVHWLFLAILVVSLRLVPHATWVLGFVAGVLVVDIVVLLIHVGPFLGEALLGVSAAAYATAAFMSR